MSHATTTRLNDLLPLIAEDDERVIAYDLEEVPSEILVRELQRRIRTGALECDLKWYVDRGTCRQMIRINSRTHDIVFSPRSALSMSVQIQKRNVKPREA